MTEEGSKSPKSGDTVLPRLQEGRKQPRALNKRDNLLSLKSQDEHLLLRLLPRLPNEIVLEEIVPRLSWKVFYSLSLVSRSWRQALQSHEVYDARVRSHSNETFLVCNHKFRADENPSEKRVISNELSLYSLRDKSWLRLPPLPQPQRGLPNESRFVSLDGKIYVLGGQTECHYSEDSRPGTNLREVYVLDLAGQTDWKRCANMPEPRLEFLCGVINGKIYVFGRKQYYNIQVYDPKENAWSIVLAPSKFTREIGYTFKVLTIGEEIFLEIDTMTREGVACDAEIYHPRKDEWRRDTNFQFLREGDPFIANGKFCLEGEVFTAHGKLHRMTFSGIYVYHVDGSLWTRLHSIPFQLPYGRDCVTNLEILRTVVTEKGELFVLADCGSLGFSVFRGKGFGKEGKKIKWEKLTCPFAYVTDSRIRHVDPQMCTIEI